MKIRTDFVTNSSSSSFVALEINSPLLHHIIKSYVNVLTERQSDTARCFPLQVEEDGSVSFTDEDDLSFSDVPSSLDHLVHQLCVGIDELSRSGFIPANEAVALVRVLKGHEQQIAQDVKRAHWIYTDQDWDEFCDPLSLDQESIDSVRREIAEEEHRPLDTVTEDDYLEYVRSMGMWMMREQEFTYDRDDNVENYRSDRYLDC